MRATSRISISFASRSILLKHARTLFTRFRDSSLASRLALRVSQPSVGIARGVCDRLRAQSTHSTPSPNSGPSVLVPKHLAGHDPIGLDQGAPARLDDELTQPFAHTGAEHQQLRVHWNHRGRRLWQRRYRWQQRRREDQPVYQHGHRQLWSRSHRRHQDRLEVSPQRHLKARSWTARAGCGLPRLPPRSSKADRRLFRPSPGTGLTPGPGREA